MRLEIPKNKKKVRGWKRQIIKLEQWKSEHLVLNLNNLTEGGYDYVKIWLDPWHRLVKRNPPIWSQRFILEALLEIYQSWNEQLIARGEKFYLKLWIFNPLFVDSQVVAAVGERIGYYESLFATGNENKTFPKQLFDINHKLSDYDWSVRLNEDIYSVIDDELTTDDIEYFDKIASRFEDDSDGDGLYYVRRGDVWIGGKNSR